MLNHLKLDLVSCCNFSWREAHNENLTSDREDQKLALLQALYVRRGKNYNYSDRREGYSRKSGGQGRGLGRSMPTATITKPGQPKEG